MFNGPKSSLVIIFKLIIIRVSQIELLMLYLNFLRNLQMKKWLYKLKTPRFHFVCSFYWLKPAYQI